MREFEQPSSSSLHRGLHSLDDIAERERSGLVALLRVTQIVNSTLDLEQVLNHVMDQIIQLTQAERGFLMLIDDQKELEIKAARNVDRESIEGSSFEISRTIVQRVVEQGKPIVTTNAQEDPRFHAQESVIDYKLLSILCVPLRVKGKVTGVIYADNRLRSGIFDDHHRDLLSAFANQAAVAIENARLFTETQQRAKELAIALARQEELDRLKSEFIQNTSHELRTPLAILRGHAEMLDSGELGELQPKQRQSVDTIARRARMLTKLLDNFAVILAVQAQEREFKPVDLGRLVHASLSSWEVAAQEAGLTFSTEIPPDLPPVSGDALHLHQVFDNLLSNAFKFTAAGGRVALRLWSERAGVVIEVTDTGIGIPADHLERIFERFYQMDGSTTRRYGGTGLGLALVKEVVEAHGGQVTVQSVVGVGSTFQISLPFAVDQG